MILVIGEILFDQFPGYRRLGGAPFNFAFHLMQFGLPVRFISRIGADEPGEEILNYLHRLHFPSEDIQIDDVKPTGMVNVELTTDGVPKFNILPDVAYDHIVYENLLKSTDESELGLIYFGSVIQRSDEAYLALHEFLSQKGSDTKCLFDVNLRPNCINEKAVIASLQKTDVLKLNNEEFEFLREMTDHSKTSEQFIDYLFDQSSIEMLALTKGDAGSDLYLPQAHYTAKSRKVEKLADTVGAGDAYAAVLAFGYMKKWHPKKILETATEFASHLCEIEGALSFSDEVYSMFKELPGFKNKRGADLLF